MNKIDAAKLVSLLLLVVVFSGCACKLARIDNESFDRGPTMAELSAASVYQPVMSQSLVPDNSGITLLFDDFQINLTGEDRTSAVRTLMLNTPIKNLKDDKPVRFKTDIRVSVNKTSDSEVTLFVSAGGVSETVTFAHGREFFDEKEITLWATQDANNERELIYELVVVIAVDCKSKNEDVLVTVDSVDILVRQQI